MKTILCLSFFILNTLSVIAQRYVADTQQSKLNWTGHSEVGSYAPTGTIQLRQGRVEVRNNQISRGRVDIDMRTIQHENEKMQTHLRGEDFFDTAAFPTATFILQQIRTGQAIGKLTIKGTTKPISFPVTLAIVGNEVRLKGQVIIDRTAFGIKYNSSSFFSGLSDYAIQNSFELAFEAVFWPGNGVAKQSSPLSRID